MPNRALVVASLVLALPLTAFGGGGGGYKLSPSANERSGPSQAKGGKLPADGVASPAAVRSTSPDVLGYGAAITYQNLTLVPVSTSAQGPFQRYTMFEKGLADKTLAVREIDGNAGQAQVNSVEVRNSGHNPVYLVGGEAILGGKQDRIIELDTVLPPSNKWIRVAVFCVEHGRWQGQNMQFGSGDALAHVALREAALSGDQSRVWAEVARKNLQQGTQSASGTYRRTIQNEALRKKLAPYRQAILAHLPADQQLAGMVFAINGQIRVADLFGNPLLFNDLRDKLLSAYLLEALGEAVDRKAAPMTVEAAKGFVTEARAAPKARKAAESGRSLNYKVESEALIGNDAFDEDSGKSVRETYIKKKK